MQKKLEKKRRIKEDYLPKEDRFHATQRAEFVKKVYKLD